MPESRGGRRPVGVPPAPPGPTSGQPACPGLSPCPRRQRGQSPAGAFASRGAPQRGQACAGSIIEFPTRSCRLAPPRSAADTPLSAIKPNAGGCYGTLGIFRGSGLQGREEVPDLVVDIGRLGQRGRDLL